MRKELEIIEEIEGYLMEKIKVSNRESFESKINADSQLQVYVNFQEELMEGLERMGLKTTASKAYKAYLLRKWLVIGSVIVGSIVLMSVFTLNYPFEKSQTDTYSTGLVQPIEIEKNTIPIFSKQQISENVFKEKKSYYQSNIISETEISIPTKTVVDTTNIADFTVDNIKPVNETNSLNSIDIRTANFYPSRFLSKINELGEFNTDFKDSLYYSYIPCSYLSSTINLTPLWQSKRFSFKRRKEELFSSILLLEKNQKFKKSYKKKNRIFSVNQANESSGSEDFIKHDSITIGYVFPSLLVDQEVKEPTYPSDKKALKTVDWKLSIIEIEDGVFDLVFQVKLSDESYIYSMNEQSKYNMPTQFSFASSASIQLIGPVQEYGMQSFNKEPFYDINAISKFSASTEVKFIQRVKMNAITANIHVNYAYMICAYGVKTLAPIEASASIQLDLIENNTGCGIQPYTIQSIKNEAFNKSNLATKEFEERMPWIHKTCNTEILALYITHLDQNLSAIDSMVVELLPHGEIRRKFEEFAARGDGKTGENLQAKIQKNNALRQPKQNLNLSSSSVDTTILNLKIALRSTLLDCSNFHGESNTSIPDLDSSKRIKIKASQEFSPNNDGIDDFYFFNLEEGYKVFELIMKDANGRIVFSTTDQNFKWYGKDLKGEKLPPGIYKGTLYTVDQENFAYEGLIEVSLMK